MVNVDNWKLDKQDKSQIVIKWKECSSWPCIKCKRGDRRTEGQRIERHIWSEIVALKGKIP